MGGQIDIREDANSRGRRFRKSYVGLIGLISGVLLLGEKLENIATSGLISYVYLFVDFFKVELLGVTLLLLLAPSRATLRRVAQDWKRGLLELPGSPLRLQSITVQLVVACLLLGVLAYQGERYMRGRQYAWTRYPNKLMRKAATAFHEQNSGRSKRLLTICEKVFDDRDCAVKKDHIESRLGHATTLRRMVAGLPKGTALRKELREDIAYLEGATSATEEALEEVPEAHVDYIAALRELKGADREAARTLLVKVQDRQPGYGEVHVLLRELSRYPLKEPLSSASPIDYPYLAALAGLGTQKFAEAVTTRN